MSGDSGRVVVRRSLANEELRRNHRTLRKVCDCVTAAAARSENPMQAVSGDARELRLHTLESETFKFEL
jgi:hypothetical protein